MKTIQKFLASILLLLLLLSSTVGSTALAARQYILPHSNIKDLTREELWEWSYESLGFILNEIFARHGYHFEVGKKYYNYFQQRPWYTPNADSDNSRACYSKLSSLEWRNEHLVKEVRAEMRALKTTNPHGKHYLDHIEDSFDVLSGFVLVDMKANQKFPVYSAPNGTSYRGANGKASVSTNGAVYVSGWENGWLMTMYATNNGSVRVGYIEGNKMKDHLTLPLLQFDRIPVIVEKATSLTDDPAMAFSPIASLSSGTQVIYLSVYHNRYAWAYVETIVNGQEVRGFILADDLNLSPILTLETDQIGEK